MNRLLLQFLLRSLFFTVGWRLLLLFGFQVLNLLVQSLDLFLPLAQLDVLLPERLGRTMQLALQVRHAGLVLDDLLLGVLELPDDALDFVVVLKDHLVGEFYLLVRLLEQLLGLGVQLGDWLDCCGCLSVVGPVPVREQG